MSTYNPKTPADKAYLKLLKITTMGFLAADKEQAERHYGYCQCKNACLHTREGKLVCCRCTKSKERS